ncbi:MAG: SPFH domain-containing protein, partial [Mycobacterium sp.]|nr:SPFH domain-containing protein [Mycobacterium sp.]
MAVVLITVLLVAALILLRSIRVAKEWNRAVVLRLGRFDRLGGPGLYLVLPLIEQVTTVIDIRIQTTSIT